MASEEQNYNNILKGRFDHLLKDRSKSVRIFMSSTFTGLIKKFIINVFLTHLNQTISDTHEERDYLIAYIYPK